MLEYIKEKLQNKIKEEMKNPPFLDLISDDQGE